MPATTDAPTVSKIISLRIPAHLEQQLAVIAARDSNSVSATARRLISSALRSEGEQEANRG
jgi:hypothetical protein